ncbi:MAG: SIS domain-containing protein [Elusimicrobia bacterium]|nr:SIS domain-containing protein [Elusimicrobiota bacterium]
MSRFEANVFAQPELIARVLREPAPAWMKAPKAGKIFFVGVGSNHHAARIAAWLWSGAGFDARAVHAYDFVSRPYRLSKGDLGVFLSHRGGAASYTVKGEARARRAGASTVAVCGAGAVWKGPKRRLETCALEDTGAFTKSLTTTLAWLLRWTGKPALLAPFTRAAAGLSGGPAFPAVSADADLVLIGDGLREWVACETALKLLETAHLRARAYGLEEFLHGPHLSVGPGSLVIGFSCAGEARWSAARRYLDAIGVPFLDAANDDWLAQIIWGQRFTIDSCRRLGIDPDALRSDEPAYKKALAALTS